MAEADTVRRGFRGLQNYTTLKQEVLKFSNACGFRGLQNYTTLKQVQLVEA